MNVFRKKFEKHLAVTQNSYTFATAIKKQRFNNQETNKFAT